MNGKYGVLHDLGNVILMLRNHIETLFAEQEGHPCLHGHTASAIRAAVERASSLLKEYAELTVEDAGESLQPYALDAWSEDLRDRLLPTLASIYKIQIHFELRAGPSPCHAVLKFKDCQTICENLIANAAFAGATRVHVELQEGPRSVDLIVRDNGCGMTSEQLHQLGLGFSTRSGNGHGRGFRIICKLAADAGAIVRPPKSIQGFGTEFTISFMKSGAGVCQESMPQSS
jgi:signal transduction histidine kinase